MVSAAEEEQLLLVAVVAFGLRADGFGKLLCTVLKVSRLLQQQLWELRDLQANGFSKLLRTTVRAL